MRSIFGAVKSVVSTIKVISLEATKSRSSSVKSAKRPPSRVNSRVLRGLPGVVVGGGDVVVDVVVVVVIATMPDDPDKPDDSEELELPEPAFHSAQNASFSSYSSSQST